MGDRLHADKPSWYVASHPGQLSLAIPPWVGPMSTSESWDVNRHTVWCTSPVSIVWQCKLVSGWGLIKRRSAPPYGPYGSGRSLRFYVLLSSDVNRTFQYQDQHFSCSIKCFNVTCYRMLTCNAHMQWTCINSKKTEVSKSISASVAVNMQLCRCI